MMTSFETHSELARNSLGTRTQLDRNSREAWPERGGTGPEPGRKWAGPGENCSGAGADGPQGRAKGPHRGRAAGSPRPPSVGRAEGSSSWAGPMARPGVAVGANGSSEGPGGAGPRAHMRGGASGTSQGEGPQARLRRPGPVQWYCELGPRAVFTGGASVPAAHRRCLRARRRNGMTCARACPHLGQELRLAPPPRPHSCSNGLKPSPQLLPLHSRQGCLRPTARTTLPVAAAAAVLPSPLLTASSPYGQLAVA